MIQASLLKELLEVVCGWSRLTLATACDSHDMHHDEAAYFLVDASIVVGHGCDLLAALLAPLLAALLGILDYDIGRCFPARHLNH
jgi:hypothetical protein